MLFAIYFLLPSLHIQTLSSHNRSRKYTINERIGPELRPEVCHWLILCYVKQKFILMTSLGWPTYDNEDSIQRVYTITGIMQWQSYWVKRLFLALLNYNICHERKCTLGKVNDEPFVTYLHKINVINPFSDIEIFLLVSGVWKPT